MEKVMKKIIRMFASLVLCMVILAGCGAKSENFSTDMAQPSPAPSDANSGSIPNFGASASERGESDDSGEIDVPDAAKVTAQVTSSRKLITRMELNMETLSFDDSCSLLEQRVSEFGGYVETSDVNSRSIYASYHSNRYAFYTLRIPSDQLDNFLNSAGDIGSITNQSTSTEDITLSYVDTESRRHALEIQLERLLSLLEKAETIEDIIALEDRISNVTYELEKNQSTLQTYDNLIDYSTVSVNLYEVERVTTIIDEKSMSEKMSSGLADTLYNIGEGIKSFAVWFVVNLPYIVFGICLIVILFVAISRHKRNRKAKKLIESVPGNITDETSTESDESSKKQ